MPVVCNLSLTFLATDSEDMYFYHIIKIPQEKIASVQKACCKGDFGLKLGLNISRAYFRNKRRNGQKRDPYIEELRFDFGEEEEKSLSREIL